MFILIYHIVPTVIATLIAADLRKKFPSLRWSVVVFDLIVGNVAMFVLYHM